MNVKLKTKFKFIYNLITYMDFKIQNRGKVNKLAKCE